MAGAATSPPPERRFTITTHLEARRRARGIGQVQLAALLGCSQPSIVNWEAGRHRPRRADVRARLEALFGCSVDELLAPVDDDPRR